ncbi:MAG TPA: hypothetical protein VGH10_12275 [Actinomycetota bacterium]|jgi:hypothetical protein
MPVSEASTPTEFNARIILEPPEVVVRVPRTDERATADDCEDFAVRTAIAFGFAEAGALHPQVSEYDGLAREEGGPMAHPQGYVFTWRRTP